MTVGVKVRVGESGFGKTVTAECSPVTALYVC